ncbi:MAG: galactokinase [Parcubacteria group bacterium]|nr:galactokinase [Parcubacteria group bacterium]
MSSFIFSRTPFRIPLGGGSTDLPSYYSKYGGFIFGVAINAYFDVFLRKPITDDNIYFQYSQYESVDALKKLNHNIGREALRIAGVDKAVSIAFKADTPAGTGLGSSGSCAVSLLNALFYSKGVQKTRQELAEHAFQITQNLGWPDGKQDPYVAAVGGFVAFEIAKNGKVTFLKPKISQKTKDRFFENSLFYYTGISRVSTPILAAQDKTKILEMKHRTKEIGYEIYKSFQEGDLEMFGRLMDEHWENKKRMSGKMSSTRFDTIYAAAKKAGALGGKIMGAGGGGYFMLYCPTRKKRDAVQSALHKFGMREMHFAIDTKGTRVKTITI